MDSRLVTSIWLIIISTIPALCSPDWFQIPDQQAFLGKLFYYQMNIPSSVKNVTLAQAGGGGVLLPEWLHFDSNSGLLFGAPAEKKIYFIQVQAIVENQQQQQLPQHTYDDIFVIEVLDPPPSLFHNGLDDSSYHCRVEFKSPIDNIHRLYKILVEDIYKSFFDLDDQTLNDEPKVKKWLAQFSISQQGKELHLSYEVEHCQQQPEHLYLDPASEQLVKRLKKLSIECELVRISHELAKPVKPAEDLDGSLQSVDGNHHHHHHHHRSHRRRNAYADDIHSTPTLAKGFNSLITSTIDLPSNEYILSRTSIPSMVSPTFTEQISPTRPKQDVTRVSTTSEQTRNLYPHLYSTPVLVPDPSTLLTKHIYDEQLSTPVFSSIEPSVVSTRPTEATSLVPEVTAETSIDSVSGNSTELPLAPPPPTIIPNRAPFVNKRISKLSIIAGKYWQFTIPEDTFMDVEDGNTRNLNLGFFIDSKMIPLDYWIHFENENQYLFALPTKDNIGKYRFDLVAIDSQGASVVESVEIFVRQSSQSLSYTHKFILSDVSWIADQYVERIRAVSTLLHRMALHVFEETSTNSLVDSATLQASLHRISVLEINPNAQQNKWIISWNNDSLRRHPCPVNEINKLFTKLYDITQPENGGFMSPSIELKNALGAEFTVGKVKRQFITRSACGSYAKADPDSSVTRHKDKIVFSNRLNRLGPYKLGEAFRFPIPKDTVYSATRQVDASVLELSLAPVEPEIDLPEFIYFDVKEKAIYGLPYKSEHVRTYELKLIAEDRLTGGSEQDLFVIDVIHDVHTREDYLFEVTMNFLVRNIELRPRSQQKLTPKDYYEVAQQISTRLMGNGNLDAFRMLDISRHRLASEPLVSGIYNKPVLEEFYDNFEDHVTEKSAKRRRSYHRLRFKRSLSLLGDFFYEFIWTNRSLVTSYLHQSNAYSGGSVFETETCPKSLIHADIYGRIFPHSVEEFMRNTGLANNHSLYDVKDAYSLLFSKIEANVDFLSVEWSPKSVCSHNPGLEPRILGTKPIRDLASSVESEDDVEEDSVDHSSQPESVTDQEGVLTDERDLDQLPTQHYLGDKLLTLIIPPIAILVALLFAVTIGCCFYRANLRRKAIGNHQSLHEESPSLFRQRIPIRFEFERGRGMGQASLGEQESMLDSKLSRQPPVNILPMKRSGLMPPPPNAPSQGRHKGPPGPHPNLPYHMLSQH